MDMIVVGFFILFTLIFEVHLYGVGSGSLTSRAFFFLFLVLVVSNFKLFTVCETRKGSSCAAANYVFSFVFFIFWNKKKFSSHSTPY